MADDIVQRLGQKLNRLRDTQGIPVGGIVEVGFSALVEVLIAGHDAAAEITRLRAELAKVIAMGMDIVDGRE